jgi:hypothetical protein
VLNLKRQVRKFYHLGFAPVPRPLADANEPRPKPNLRIKAFYDATENTVLIQT